MELCASPLNCRYRRFCGAFPDADAPFGSMGDAFEFRPTRGSFEVNPPFDPGFVARLVAHLEALLRASREPLSFCVVAPTSDPGRRRRRRREGRRRRRGGNVDAPTPVGRRSSVVVTFKANAHAYVAGGGTRARRGRRRARRGRARRSERRGRGGVDVGETRGGGGGGGGGGEAGLLAALRRGFAPEGARSGARGGAFAEEGAEGDGEGIGTGDRTRSDVRSASGVCAGTAWDPTAREFMLWGAGSARRWGAEPAAWVLEEAADVIEDHWVGGDTSESEEEEGEEEESASEEEEEEADLGEHE